MLAYYFPGTYKDCFAALDYNYVPVATFSHLPSTRYMYLTCGVYISIAIICSDD